MHADVDIPTAAGLRRLHRRLDRRLAGHHKAAEIITAMREGGHVLRMHSNARGRPIWSLSSGSSVSPEVAALVIANSNIIPDKDALPLNIDVPAQTWRHR